MNVKEITMDWTKLKEIVLFKKLYFQHSEIETDQYDTLYYIFAIDENIVYNCSINDTDNADDVTDFEDNYKAQSNKPLEQRSPSGKPLFITAPKEGNRTVYVSHDFCDKTSWWQNGVKVQGETLTDSGDHLTYNFAHQFIIDANKISDRDAIYNEDLLDPNITHKVGMRVRYYKIYVDDEHTTEGFTMDFAAGTITFDSSQEGKTVTSDYYYATIADYVVAPPNGMKLRVYRTETQFTDDLDNFPSEFQIIAGGNVVHSKTYLNFGDYLNESNLGYRIQDFPMGGAVKKNVIFLPWDYVTTIDIRSTYGMSIKIIPENNTEALPGTMATATIYATYEEDV